MPLVVLWKRRLRRKNSGAGAKKGEAFVLGCKGEHEYAQSHAAFCRSAAVTPCEGLPSIPVILSIYFLLAERPTPNGKVTVLKLSFISALMNGRI